MAPPKRFADTGKANARYGPLLSRQNELMNSINYRIQGNLIIISTDKIYAKIHNEGGTMNITIPISYQMRRFAWAKMYESKRYGKNAVADKWL
jgi:phage gpG-like protein